MTRPKTLSVSALMRGAKGSWSELQRHAGGLFWAMGAGESAGSGGIWQLAREMRL
jgi:hypothetical protein